MASTGSQQPASLVHTIHHIPYRIPHTHTCKAWFIDLDKTTCLCESLGVVFHKTLSDGCEMILNDFCFGGQNDLRNVIWIWLLSDIDIVEDGLFRFGK